MTNVKKTTASPPDGHATKIIQSIVDLWQLIGVGIAFVTAVIASVSYFATHAQLEKIECLSKQDLLRQLLPSRIEQLRIDIKLAEADSTNILQGTPTAIAHAADIEQYKRDLANAKDELSKLPRLDSHLCESAPETKK